MGRRNGVSSTSTWRQPTTAYVLKILPSVAREIRGSAHDAKEELLKLTEPVEPIAPPLVLGAKVNEAFEAVGMFALFLKDSGLSPFGSARPGRGLWSGSPDDDIRERANGTPGRPTVLKHGNGGFWWEPLTLYVKNTKKLASIGMVGLAHEVRFLSAFTWRPRCTRCRTATSKRAAADRATAMNPVSMWSITPAFNPSRCSSFPLCGKVRP